MFLTHTLLQLPLQTSIAHPFHIYSVKNPHHQVSAGCRLCHLHRAASVPLSYGAGPSVALVLCDGTQTTHCFEIFSTQYKKMLRFLING